MIEVLTGRRWATLAALLSGALAVFGFAPFGFWPATLLSLLVGFVLIHAAPTPCRAAWIGGAYGLAYFLGTVHWLYIALHVYGSMPAPLAALCILGFCAFLALYPVLAAWFAHRLVPQGGPLRLVLALPAAWATSEWLRGWLFTGFPWAATGYSQVPDGPLAGWLPVLGLYGVNLLLALLAGCLAAAVLALCARTCRRALWMALPVAMIVAAGLALRPIAWTGPEGAPVRVALVQGGIPQDQKWREEARIATLKTYLHQVRAARADLVVLPETAFPVFLHELPDDYLQALTAPLKAQGAALIVGAPRLDAASQRYYNAAVLLTDPARPAYYKSHLVPFGEYIPLTPIFGWFYETVLNIPLAGFTPGRVTQRTLDVAGLRIAANICYEDVFGEALIAGARRGNVLLNLSNLAWYDGSIALAQHGQIAQARALETGRPVLRATNTGTTALIGPDGRYSARLPERVSQTLTVTVRGTRGETPYLRWGNAPAVALMAALLVIAAWAARRR